MGKSVCILRSISLSVHFDSSCFYIQYHGGIREVIDSLLYIMFSIINTMKKH